MELPLFTRLSGPLGLSEITPLKVVLPPVALRVSTAGLNVLLLMTLPAEPGLSPKAKLPAG